MSEKNYYVSKEGRERLHEEYGKLLEIKKHLTQRGIPGVLHSDDIDPEYLSRYEDMSLLDARIADLQHILKNAAIIKPPPRKARNVVHVGAEITLEINGHADRFEIVGTLEANPVLGKISNESPVGKTLLGRRVGEEVVISSPIRTRYKIKKITYRKN